MTTALNDQFRAVTGGAGVLTAPEEMAPFLTDWRGIVRGEALAVVRPSSTAQVAAVLRICAARGVRVTPQGGNTGLAYGAVPPRGHEGVVLSLGRMNAVRSIDPVGMTMAVEAGCVLQAAREQARAVNRQLPISLAAEGSAQIGGVIATNAGGVNVLRHGMARTHVLGLEVVLADGTILDGMRELRKDNAGYDWKQWFIGSEGTLGVITAAVLKLSPSTRHSEVALLSVDSCEAALLLLSLFQDRIGDALSAFELMAGDCLALVERHFGHKAPITPANWHILLQADANLAGLRPAIEETFALAFEQGLALDGVVAESVAQAKSLWSLRELITEAEQREGRSAKHDLSIPIRILPEFLANATSALLERFPGARLNPFGHLGDGNIHFNVMMPNDAQVGEVNALVHRLTIAARGSVSAEHGVGRYRREAMREMRSPTELKLMSSIKRLLDPKGILNPDAVV